MSGTALDTHKTPILPTIASPADLRRLPVEALPQVCAEIREFLIDSLSRNPGHFASSMGAVEITVALHYVFDTPYDRIVWDVGHQAYGHKLLTGRQKAFAGNRKAGGLSGFPNPDESEYDTFAAGHASNSISAALCMAIASGMKHETPRRNVVAVIGDASISGGLAFEGINNAANTPNNLLIILNDNDMSIDNNVGALNKYLTQINTSKAYNNIRYKAYKTLKKLHLVSEQRRGAVLRFSNSIKSLISKQQNLFEGFNIRYFGPFDGHDVITLVRVLTDIRDMTGPRLLHIRTTKGKGYAPAEADPAAWHAPGIFDPATGVRAETTAKKDGPIKYQDVFGNTLLELARTNPAIVGISAAMLSGTSVAIMHEAMPDRVFDVGISEGHAVTFAGGLAKEGLRPFVAIYSSFLQRAYDHIIHDVALNRLPVTLCIDRAGLVGEDGATHHGAYDLAYLRAIPNLTVASGRDEHALRNLLYTAQAADHGPFAIRYPRGKGSRTDWKNDMHAIEIGKGERLSDGTDVAVLTIGPVAADAADAIALAKEKGISAAHYDMIFLKPIDEDILREVAGRNCPIITVEDGTVNGGLGGAVAEWMSAHGATQPVVRLGIPDRFIPQGTPGEQHRMCGFDSGAILDAIEKATHKSDCKTTQK